MGCGACIDALATQVELKKQAASALLGKANSGPEPISAVVQQFTCDEREFDLFPEPVDLV